MNRFAMEYIRNRDGRNPYGSRGGYVVNSRRDRAYSGGMDRNEMEYNYPSDYDERYGERDYNYHSRDMNDMRGRGNRMGDREYGNDSRYYNPMMMGMPERYDYYNSRYDMEFNEPEKTRLTNREMKMWKNNLINADGSRGEKYTMEQILPIAQQLGIKFHEFSEEDLCMAVNMLYSDYCKVLGADLGMYVKLAKAFLEDDDFDGTGSEKLALYYKCIASDE